MTAGPRSSLADNVHKAILEVLEDPSLIYGLSLDNICKVKPQYHEFFGLRNERGHRRRVTYQKNNYKKRKAEDPKNYARACFKFGVNVDEAANPIVFDWVEIFKADRDEVTEEAETMTSSTKKTKTANCAIRREEHDDDDDDDVAAVGFADDFF